VIRTSAPRRCPRERTRDQRLPDRSGEAPREGDGDSRVACWVGAPWHDHEHPDDTASAAAPHSDDASSEYAADRGDAASDVTRRTHPTVAPLAKTYKVVSGDKPIEDV